jgi:hypothetical protein
MTKKTSKPATRNRIRRYKDGDVVRVKNSNDKVLVFVAMRTELIRLIDSVARASRVTRNQLFTQAILDKLRRKIWRTRIIG